MTVPATKGRSRATGFAGLIVALLMLAAIAWIGMDPAISALEWLELRVDRYFWPALAAYTALFTLLVLTTLPIGTIFCLVGGYLFGLSLGSAAAVLAATSGATLTLLLVRGLGGSELRNKLNRSRLEPWLKLLERDATWYLILLRLIPVMPFFPVNAAAGLVHIRVRHFAAATALGLLPTTLIYASIGNGLNSVMEARELAGPDLLLEPEVGLPLAALAVLIVTALILRRRLLGRPG